LLWCCERRKKNSGFEAIFVLAGLLVAYLLRRRARNGRSRKYIPTMIAVLVLLSMIFIGQHIPFSTHDYDRIVSDQKGGAPVDIDLISLSSLSFPDENKLFVTLRVNGEIVDDARYDIGIYTKRRIKTTGMGDVAPITPLYLIMDGRGMDIRFPEAVVAYQNRGIEATRYGNESEEIRGVEIEGIGTDTLIFSIPLEPFEGKELYWISASARGEKGSDFCSGTTRISYCAPLLSLYSEFLDWSRWLSGISQREC